VGTVTSKTGKNNAWQTLADILSAGSIVFTFVVMPLWCHYDPNYHNHGLAGAPVPIQFKLFVANVIPLIAAIMWLTVRYGEAVAARWPFVRTAKFRYTSWGISVSFVLLMEYLWKVH
jgi:hypothetical protein